MVVYGIQRGLGMEVFPVDLIYRPWKHSEGQVRRRMGQVRRLGQVYVNVKTLNTLVLFPEVANSFIHINELLSSALLTIITLFQLSFIQHSLMIPDVFCFADYPCHTVAIDILKAPFEDNNREIATWYVKQFS
jgi:CCR4-NOT transcription complex subunit 1